MHQIDKQKLVTRLEREVFAEKQGDAFERGYRAGWNDRSRSLIREADTVDLDGIDIGGEG